MTGGGDTSVARLGRQLKSLRLAQRAAIGRAAKARRLAVLAVAQGADGGGSGVASECTHGSPVGVEESGLVPV